MDEFMSVSSVTRRIRELEDQQKQVEQRLEKAQTQKKEGARFYQGTELLIDDVIFSIREGQARSVRIALDFYRKTLTDLDPATAPAVEPVQVKAIVKDSVQ